MREEFDASQKVKREAKIIVVLGNPPYDRFTGAAQAEEAELVAHYKGIELVEERPTRDGSIKRDEFGRRKRNNAARASCTRSLVFASNYSTISTSGSSVSLKNVLARPPTMASISYISNSSYLTGRSHPLMRRSLLSNFHAVWIDNLNGDKYRTGKIIPKGLPGAGTRDDSAFTTEMDPRGIQPGTAIATWVKRTGNANEAGRHSSSLP